MKQSKNTRGNGQKRQYRGNRQEQAIAKNPVNSFEYKRNGLTGVVHINMMNGNTVQVQIPDPSVGIRTIQSKLKFYAAYEQKNLNDLFDAIRAHAQELKFIETIWLAIQTKSGQLQLGDKNFLVVEATMEANTALKPILARAASFATAQTPSKNGSKVSTDQQRPNA